jgi:uncharacterized repeat protein (TIGR02543 family)
MKRIVFRILGIAVLSLICFSCALGLKSSMPSLASVLSVTIRANESSLSEGTVLSAENEIDSGVSPDSYVWRYSADKTTDKTTWDIIESQTASTYTITGLPVGTYITVAVENKNYLGTLWATNVVQVGNNNPVPDPTKDEYLLSFDSQGGSYVPPLVVSKGTALSTYEPATDPTRTGWTFGGWYTSSTVQDETTEVNWTTAVMPAEALPLYAEWDLVTYTITYNTNGGTFSTPPTANYTIESAEISLPADTTAPTLTDYVFEGWYTDENFTGNRVYTIPQGSTGDKIYWAKWEPVPDPTKDEYLLSFDSQGGSYVPPLVVSKETALSTYEPATDPTRTGWSFGGWYKDTSFTVAVDWATDMMPAEALTLYAKWTPEPEALVPVTLLDLSQYIGSRLAVSPYTTSTEAIAYDQPVPGDQSNATAATALRTSGAASFETEQYTADVEWSDGDGGDVFMSNPVNGISFFPGKVYTATVTITAKSGWTLSGANFAYLTYTSPQIEQVVVGDDIEVTIVFPATGGIEGNYDE